MVGGREARRRRILTGSQERLALITGRTQHAPSSSFESFSTDLGGPSGNTSPQYEDADPHPSGPASVQPREVDILRRDRAADRPLSRGNDLVGGSKEDPLLRNRGIGSYQNPTTTRTIYHASEIRGRTDAPSSAQIPLNMPVTINPELLLSSLLNLFGSVTLQQLDFAISATEHSRRYYSIAMAVLVLLSYVGFPIVGSKFFRSFILFRPFLLLLLINVFSIFLRLLPKLLSDKDKDRNRAVAVADVFGWAEAGRAIEVGFMLQNLFVALFMDLSVYAIIIVCGFCLH